MIPIAQSYPQYPSSPHDDRSTRHRQVNGNFAASYWCHSTCSTVLRAKELSAIGHPKLFWHRLQKRQPFCRTEKSASAPIYSRVFLPRRVWSTSSSFHTTSRIAVAPF